MKKRKDKPLKDERNHFYKKKWKSYKKRCSRSTNSDDQKLKLVKRNMNDF